MSTTSHLIISCEHAGSLIPPAWRGLFVRYAKLLTSHEAYDPGALTLARTMAEALGGELFFAKTSRLLVDLNRSPGHPQLFSAITRKLAPAGRQNILNQHYRPYRSEVERAIRSAIDSGKRVVHIASHSFAPELKGRVRNIDIGLLYDPARPGEVALCDAWAAALKHEAPDFKVRRNAPYRGTSDGMTAAMRKLFDAQRYVGIELEVNQKHVLAKNRHWPRLRVAIVRALREAIAATFPNA